MDGLDGVSLVVAMIKDKVRNEVAKEFRDSYRQLLEADATARRTKTKALILQMSKLKFALNRFELSYNSVIEECGHIEAVDKYIADIKLKINQISYIKNRPL